MADGIVNFQVVNSLDQVSNSLSANVSSSTVLPIIITHPSSVNYATKVRYKTDSLYTGPGIS